MVVNGGGKIIKKFDFFTRLNIDITK